VASRRPRRATSGPDSLPLFGCGGVRRCNDHVHSVYHRQHVRVHDEVEVRRQLVVYAVVELTSAGSVLLGPPTSLMSRQPSLGAFACVGTSTIACRLDVCGKAEAAGQCGVVEEGDLLDPVAA
jgi:hypothetical protein